jgi:uncharacterized membrane protein
VKIIGIKLENLGRAEWAVETLKTAVEAKRVTLEDIALVTKDEEGKIHLHQTGDITTRKGAKRGTLVGAVVGLAAPPLLAAAVVGAGVGAVWGKFRDRGIDDDLMKNVGEVIASGEAVVFAMGDNASIDAIEARARELGIGDLTSFEVDDASAAVFQEASEEVPEPSAFMSPLRYS